MNVRIGTIADEKNIHALGCKIPELQVIDGVEWISLQELEKFTGTFVIAEESEIIGFIYFTENDLDGENSACIVYMAVSPEYRGQGIAQEMYDYLSLDNAYCWVGSVAAENFMLNNGWIPGKMFRYMEKC